MTGRRRGLETRTERLPADGGVWRPAPNGCRRHHPRLDVL